MLKDVEAKLAVENIRLVVTDAARDALAELGYDPKYGARPLRKVIVRKIEDELADKMLAGELKGVIGISVDVAKEDGEYRVIFDTL